MLILWEWYIYYEGKSFFFSRKYNFKYCVIDGGFHFCWWFKLRFSFIWNFQKFDRNFNEWNDNSPWKNPSCTAMTLPTLSSCIMSSWFTLFLFILDVHNLSLLFFFYSLLIVACIFTAHFTGRRHSSDEGRSSLSPLLLSYMCNHYGSSLVFC